MLIDLADRFRVAFSLKLIDFRFIFVRSRQGHFPECSSLYKQKFLLLNYCVLKNEMGIKDHFKMEIKTWTFFIVFHCLTLFITPIITIKVHLEAQMCHHYSSHHGFFPACVRIHKLHTKFPS